MKQFMSLYNIATLRSKTTVSARSAFILKTDDSGMQCYYTMTLYKKKIIIVIVRF